MPLVEMYQPNGELSGDNSNPESNSNEENQHHPLYQYLRGVTTPDSVLQRKQKLLESLDPEKSSQVKALLEEKRALHKPTEIQRSLDEWSEVFRRTDEIDELLYSDDLESTYRRIREIENMDDWDGYRPDTKLAKAMLLRLSTVAENSHHTDRAMLFHDMDTLPYDPSNQRTIYLTSQETINFPTGCFASAKGFENWYGRLPGVTKDGRDSYEVIKDYASRDADSTPPLHDITAYLFPNGELLILTGNSHRVSAAIHRGDTHIPFKGEMTVILMDQNSTPLDPDYYNQKNRR
jgi:hypothetical protein